jgi:hypothetical protein
VYVWTSENPEGPVYQHVSRFSDEMRPVELDFFDDDEIVLTIETRTNLQYSRSFENRTICLTGFHTEPTNPIARYLASVRLDSIAIDSEPLSSPLLDQVASIVEQGIDAGVSLETLILVPLILISVCVSGRGTTRIA